MAELRARCGSDAALLSVTVTGGVPLGPVSHLQAGLSDPHAHGRTVALVEFAGGARLVYKPRSLRADAAFGAFLDWLSAKAPDLPPLRGVRTLDRGTYGWAEYVATAPCADAAAVARYHERCGALLAAAYVLRVGDLHSENVVAAGEHPLLIDLEAALAPSLRPPGGRDARGGGDAVARSVLETGLLPVVYVDAAERGFVEGGIAPMRECLTQNGGRDALRADAVARGFDRAYRAMQQHGAALLSCGGPLAAFAGARVRMVLRATNVYAALLRRLAAPHRVNDPAARAAELERLARPFRDRPEWARMLPAFAAEARALARGDVPRFELAADGTALRADGRVVVPGYAETSGLAAVRCRVRALGDADRRRQLQYVRLAFAADAHRRASRAAVPIIDDTGPGAGPELDREAALAEARRLGALLIAIAERSRDGRAARWQVRDANSGAPTLRPLDASLGHGQGGVGLVFAALHACDGSTNDALPATRAADAPDWGGWARLALRPVCDAVDRGGRLGRVGTVGFASGGGGVALALACAGDWLGEPGIRARADAVAAALLNSSHPRAERADGDVFGGVAGAVHGLLAVYEHTRETWILERAARAGGALAATLAVTPESGRKMRRCRHAPGWESVPGFGFGAPGRAAVLLRLATHTGERTHARVAAAALSSVARGVSDRLAAAPNATWERAGGWCRGDVGAGFALAAALAVGAPNPDAGARWRAALTRIASAAADATIARTRMPHALCCGAFARVDLLLDAAEVLHDAAARAAARRLAHALAARAGRRLAYHPVPYAEPLAPALFGGLAGVAYTLLRIARPDVAPSVLRAAAAPRAVEPALYPVAPGCGLRPESRSAVTA